MSAPAQAPLLAAWEDCRFLTASVLPVRVACNLRCPFCFSKASISALARERIDWRSLDIDGYYAFARERGASRLVITGGGEPLLRPDDVLWLVERGRRHFDEVALFTNGALLNRPLARALQDAGLSYVCWSRHHEDDVRNRALMGSGAPSLDDFLEAAGTLPVRATCVMVQGYVDSHKAAWRYVRALAAAGIREFTLKHTYTAYEQSVFRGSPTDRWAEQHRVELDPFQGVGEIVAELPWGPQVRLLHGRDAGLRVCWYHEPTPRWEQENRLCRSSNLLSDGAVYASLEDQRSLLYRLAC